MNRPPPSLPSTTYNQVDALNDISGVHWVVHEFLRSRMLESEEYCHRVDPRKERLYVTTVYGIIQCFKGLLSFEDKDLLSAIDDTKHGNAIAAAHRRRPPSLAGRLASYILPGLGHLGPEWILQMTPVERHAELMYAESLYLKSLLSITYSGDWLSFVKEILNMRTTISIYRQLGRSLDAADAAYAALHSQGCELAQSKPVEDPSIDRHFRSGVYLGCGMSHLILSLMPGRLLAIVELFGYRGDRQEGLRLLERAGGWDRGSDGEVVSQEDEGIRRPICDMSLLIFHLVLSAYTFNGIDVNLARRIVEWNLQRYPNGVFFLFGAGRLALARSQPERALEYYARAVQCQSQYPNLHHISWWESAIANLALWNVEASKGWWSHLEAEASWSKATYTYGEAACLATLGDHSAAAALMQKVPDLKQRIAGKSIPIEKFVARKARKYLAQNNHLLLPALEFGYIFSAIAHAPRQVVLERMLPNVWAALSDLGLQGFGANSTSGTPVWNDLTSRGDRRQASGGKVVNGGALAARGAHWDDVCLARFLEGVCWRFVAYPDPDAEVDRSEVLAVSVEDASQWAAQSFQMVFQHAAQIELDHYLEYHAHFEYGRLLARSGRRNEARTQFNSILSGNPPQANAAGRKGKYSLENALHIRTHAALDALSQGRPL